MHGISESLLLYMHTISTLGPSVGGPHPRMGKVMFDLNSG